MPIIPQSALNRLRRQLAIDRRDLDDLVSACFNSTGLSCHNVSGACRNNGFMWPQACRDGNGIGGRSTWNEEYTYVVSAEMSANALTSELAKCVAPVASVLYIIVDNESFKDLRMGTFAVVVDEAVSHRWWRSSMHASQEWSVK